MTANSTTPLSPMAVLSPSQSQSVPLEQSRTLLTQSGYFPGFCTPCASETDVDSDDESHTDAYNCTANSNGYSNGSSKPSRNKPRKFFSSIHDQIRDYEDHDDNDNSDDNDIFTPCSTGRSPVTSPPVLVRPSSYNNLVYYPVSAHTLEPRDDAPSSSTESSGVPVGDPKSANPPLRLDELTYFQHRIRQLHRSNPPRVPHFGQLSANGMDSTENQLLVEAARRAQLSVILRDLKELEM